MTLVDIALSAFRSPNISELDFLSGLCSLLIISGSLSFIIFCVLSFMEGQSLMSSYSIAPVSDEVIRVQIVVLKKDATKKSGSRAVGSANFLIRDLPQGTSPKVFEIVREEIDTAMARAAERTKLAIAGDSK